jgi:hypothetical protein
MLIGVALGKWLLLAENIWETENVSLCHFSSCGLLHKTQSVIVPF